jgi:hypothetical protein
MERENNDVLSKYFKKHGFCYPDLLINSTSLDVVARSHQELHRPFKGFKKHQQSGCYLYFDLYDEGGKTKIIPIYVGKSTHLSKRLYSHWHNSDGMVNDYFTDAEAISDCHNTLYQYTNTNFPLGLCMFAVWFQDNEKERMYMEHKLIGITRPLYNKG